MNYITFTKINTMKKKSLNTKSKNYFYYEKLRLTDDYQYESEKEEKEQQTSKKELLKKPTEEDDSNFNDWVNKKETSINSDFLSFKDPVICLNYYTRQIIERKIKS